MQSVIESIKEMAGDFDVPIVLSQQFDLGEQAKGRYYRVPEPGPDVIFIDFIDMPMLNARQRLVSEIMTPDVCLVDPAISVDMETYVESDIALSLLATTEIPKMIELNLIAQAPAWKVPFLRLRYWWRYGRKKAEQ
jgi:hypothetical protein